VIDLVVRCENILSIAVPVVDFVRDNGGSCAPGELLVLEVGCRSGTSAFSMLDICELVNDVTVGAIGVIVKEPETDVYCEVSHLWSWSHGHGFVGRGASLPIARKSEGILHFRITQCLIGQQLSS
jgi:hypothetical protein